MSKKALIIAASLVLALGAAVGVGVYFILQIQSLSHPPEETAKFLPMETSLYVSMNLRPGAGQLTKARDILDLFKENPKFEEKLDELYWDIEEETGINVEEDLFPWLGPEIAMAIPIFEGIDETPEFVAFIGATDRAAAESFLRKLIAFGKESAGTEYEEGVTRGYLTFVVDTPDDSSAHIALTDDYIVIATGAETLESTLDRMDSGQDLPSLFDNPGFQEAREAAESPRFGIMYVDIAGITDRLGEDSNEELVDNLEDFSDQLPDFIVASSSFIDEGILVSTSFDYPVQDQLLVPASTNSVGSAGLAPEDTVALLSFVGVQEAWERIKDEVGDLPDLDLGEVFDEVEAEIGVDIDQDIFGWMTGELAFAMLLPDGVSFSTDEIHANVYVEFADRDKALSSIEKIQDAIEDGGVEFHVVDIKGTDAVVVDLGDEQGLPSLMPGYVVLEDYVVIGTTLMSLRQAVEAGRGDIPSLRESSAFSRSLATAGNSTDFMIYGNIRRISQEVLDQLDETELEEYGDTAEPFVEPLEALFLGVTVEEDLVTISAVITFSAPTDAPASENTATREAADSSVEVEIDVDDDTLWQEVFDRFSASEQTCIRNELGGELLASVLGLPVLSETGVEPWLVSIFECIDLQTADALFLAGMLAGMQGQDLDLDTAHCIRELVADTDVAGMIASELPDASPDNIAMAEEFSDKLFACLQGQPQDGPVAPTVEPVRIIVPTVSLVEAIAAATPPGYGPDRDVLIALYDATAGVNWINNTNWLSEAPLGEWHGVTTDANGRVTRLLLRTNQLTGEIPPELGSLSNLTHLSIWQGYRMRK